MQISDSSKPCIVVSGVNLTEMGPLAVFREALASLTEHYAANYEIVALVHRQRLLDIPNVTYMEFPNVKSSWLRRLRFEYWECKGISQRLKPKLWFAMDNMTPNVTAEKQVVYCHNPSPFYRFHPRDLFLDWKFGLFTLFYRYLYRINIRRNAQVIVQQEWIRKYFVTHYGVSDVIVAHPNVVTAAIAPQTAELLPGKPYRFFYPAYPRTFKNSEVALRAARLLERNGFHDFELWLTFDGTVNKYASAVFKQFSNVRTVRWLGLLTRQKVFEKYADADCLLFPSKLETWGLPITEFKSTGKPIIAADLAYAHETVGSYAQVAFFNPTDIRQLAEIMRAAATGVNPFAPVIADPISRPFSSNWVELWRYVIPAQAKPAPISTKPSGIDSITVLH